MRMKAPNQDAPGNGATTLLFHVGRLGRAVPERGCSASKHTKYMRASLLLGCILLSFVGCSTTPRPSQSSYFRAEVAGYIWRKNGTAHANFILAVLSNAPRPLYIEAVLPAPEGGPSEPIRKTVSLDDSRVNFDGPVLSGWKPGTIYFFRLRAYADAGYTRMIDSLEQRSLCSKPPERYLRQLKDE